MPLLTAQCCLETGAREENGQENEIYHFGGWKRFEDRTGLLHTIWGASGVPVLLSVVWVSTHFVWWKLFSTSAILESTGRGHIVRPRSAVAEAQSYCS
jgi:hypothetical protein